MHTDLSSATARVAVTENTCTAFRYNTICGMVYGILGIKFFDMKIMPKFNDVCFSASDDINIRKNSMISLFTASDDVNIRHSSIIPVFQHLMILRSDKLQ